MITVIGRRLREDLQRRKVTAEAFRLEIIDEGCRKLARADVIKKFPSIDDENLVTSDAYFEERRLVHAAAHVDDDVLAMHRNHKLVTRMFRSPAKKAAQAASRAEAGADA